MIIDIYRGAGINLSFTAGEDNVIFTRQLMTEHKITAIIPATDPLDIAIGDYITHQGEQFTVNSAPRVTRTATRQLEYEVVFEGQVYRLYNKILMDEGSADFSYFGTPSDYISLLLTNINAIDSGWTSGTVYDAVEPKHLSFNNETCREALTRIAELFGLEFYLVNRQINVVEKVGEDIFLTLEYGKGKGLYNLTRQTLNDKNVITRLYAFGSEKNLSYDYRGGAKRLTINPPYLEQNILLYGVIEHSITFDDIFPNRTGSVTAINASSVFEITDTGIDFDINSYLLEGVVAKIVFKSGDLAGYEFEIVNYNHTTKTITFKRFVEENDYILPNDTVKPALGDEYTLVDIKMPQLYIDAAEADLQAKAQAYLNEHSQPVVTYGFDCDEKFVRDFGLSLKIGDRVRVVDTGLGIDTTLRISNISYPVPVPSRITAQITEGLQYTTEERLIRVASDSRKQIREVNRSSVELARLNNFRMRELQELVFDPDGYFDTENIKPASIETIHMAVGTKSQQFALSGIVFSPNQDSDPAKFAWTAGNLIHYAVEEAVRTWDIALGSLTGLLAGEAYYIYARCPIVGVQASIVLDTAQIKPADEAGFYHFLIGVLHSVVDGVRGISLTYGTTEINGKFIRTGVITSQDGLTYFDLDAGEIGGKISFAAGSSGYQNLSDLPGSNPYFEMGTKLWSRTPNGAASPEDVNYPVINGVGSWGGKAIEINGNNIIYYSNSIPIDLNKTYKGRVRVRQLVDPTTSGKSQVYAGVNCYDKDHNYIATQVHFITYFTNITNSQGWVVFEGIIKGQGSSGNNAFRIGTAYVKPYVAVNYNDGDGTAQIDGLEFFDITDAVEEADAAEAAAIAAASADATTKVNNLEAALGGMAYEDLVGLAKLDNTVIEGGYIKTSLIDVNTLIVSGDLETTSGAQTKADAAESAANDYASPAVSQMSNPHFEQDKRLWSTSRSGASVPEASGGTIVVGGSWGGKVLQLENEHSHRYWKNAIPVDVDRIYRGRFRVRQIVDPSYEAKVYGGVACLDNNYNPISNVYFIISYQTITSAEGWREFTATITGTQFPAGTVYVRPLFIVNYNPVDFTTNNGTAQVDGLEFFDVTDAVEAENNAKAYTDNLEAALGDMAYDDLVTLARLDSTIIQGGYIKTSLIDVNTLIVTGDLETTTGAQSKVDTLAASLGNMAYEDLVGLAKLDTTVIQGGYIKTSLIDVDTLIVKHVLTAASGRRVHIDGDNNRMIFYNTSGIETVRMDDVVGSDGGGNSIGGLVAKNSTDTRRSYLSGAGVFSNASALAFVPALAGIETNASIVGILFDRNTDFNGVSAGVVGFDNSTSGNSISFGGYFDSLMAGGLHVGLQRLSSNTVLSDTDTYINCINTSTITLWLPGSPKIGHMLMIRRPGAGVTVNGNGNNILNGSTSSSTYAIPTGVNVFVWDGFYWLRSIMPW